MIATARKARRRALARWRHQRGQLGQAPPPAVPAQLPASNYPNAYSVARLVSYRDWWSKQMAALKPADFTPKQCFDATDPLVGGIGRGMVGECRMTILYGRSGPSISPPPPYPFRNEVWAAADAVQTLRDGSEVIVKKGATGKFWSPANAQAYWAATYNKGRTLFDELITSMTTFEDAQAKGPPLAGPWSDLLVWGGLLWLAVGDWQRSGD